MQQIYSLRIIGKLRKSPLLQPCMSILYMHQKVDLDGCMAFHALYSYLTKLQTFQTGACGVDVNVERLLAFPFNKTANLIKKLGCY